MKQIKQINIVDVLFYMSAITFFLSLTGNTWRDGIPLLVVSFSGFIAWVMILFSSWNDVEVVAE